jgi:hypothetical protein
MSAVARDFRRLMRQARYVVPADRQRIVVGTIRTKFRCGDAVDDAERTRRVEDALKLLAVVSVRQASKRGTVGSRRLVVAADGTVVEAEQHARTAPGQHYVHRDMRITNDQVERHKRLVRRQHFMDR